MSGGNADNNHELLSKEYRGQHGWHLCAEFFFKSGSQHAL
jgi:hypothetical protein